MTVRQLLLVEDDEPLAEQTARALEHRGNRVAVAHNAEQALALLARLPDLAGAIRQAQVQMHPLRRKGSIEGDDFKVSLQHGGLGLAGALKGRLGEVADHTENEAADAVPSGQLFEAEAQITAGSKLQRQGTHGASKGCSRLRNLVSHDIVLIL